MSNIDKIQAMRARISRACRDTGVPLTTHEMAEINQMLFDLEKHQAIIDRLLLQLEKTHNLLDKISLLRLEKSDDRL